MLKGKDLGRFQEEPVRLELCGNMPTQHIIFGTEMELSWKSVIRYEESSSFCFSYQPIANTVYFISSAFQKARCNLPYLHRPRGAGGFCRDITTWDDSSTNEYYNDIFADAESSFETALTCSSIHYVHVLLELTAIRYFWLATGTVVNIPVVTISTFTCRRQETAGTIDDVQLKAFSCFGHHVYRPLHYGSIPFGKSLALFQ